jgi:hypothetical protein
MALLMAILKNVHYLSPDHFRLSDGCCWSPRHDIRFGVLAKHSNAGEQVLFANEKITHFMLRHAFKLAFVLLLLPPTTQLLATPDVSSNFHYFLLLLLTQ